MADGLPATARKSRALILSLLIAAYTLNFIDRTIIGTIGQAIKVDLGISDTRLGLLGGTAFALFYAVCSLPIARMADSRNRVKIISVAVIIWSGFTALCGLAQNYVQLLLLRAAVGFGEAGLTPPAYSLISSYYEPERRASALALFCLGIPLGTMVGAVAGGWLAQTFSWREAFAIVGAPGLVVGLLIWWLVPEPSPHRLAASPKATNRASLSDVARIVFLTASLRNFILGNVLVSFASYGIGLYQQPYFVRFFGMSYSQVGLIFGLIGGFSAAVGVIVGGYLTDWAGRRNIRWYALIPALGLVLAGPLYALAFTIDNWALAAAMLVVPGICQFLFLGPTLGVIQNSVGEHMRATASALLLLVTTLIALGLGPPFFGLCIDLLTQHHFATLSAGDYLTLCPGGVAAAGAPEALKSACSTSIALGTRQAIAWNTLFYAWSALHYLLAARSLPRDFARLRAAQEEARPESVQTLEVR